MPPHHLNVLAIFAATLSAFVIGGLWYSPLLFAGVLQRVNGLSAADLAGQNKRVWPRVRPNPDHGV